MKIRLINRAEFDYLDIGLALPNFTFETEYDLLVGRTKYRQIVLETSIRYREEEYFKYFTIRLLGFGFYIARQTGY